MTPFSHTPTPQPTPRRGTTAVAFQHAGHPTPTPDDIAEIEESAA